MFCEKCGTQLPIDAAFCTNCGSSVHKSEKIQEKIEDGEVKLNVKPIFKLGYMMINESLVLGLIFCMFIPIFMIMSLIGDGFSATRILLGSFLVYGIIFFIWRSFRKMQYDNYSYDFYNTKVIYKDGFLNKSEKEVKYKYIREVVKRESFLQRIFNLGTIILYTNAETGYGNGICISNIEDVDNVYKKIKNIIDG